MKLARRYEPIADYVALLQAQIRLVAERLPGRMRLSHLHWGGGTPTSLSPDDLARVMANIRARFDLGPDAEVAIECDPRTLSPAMARRVGALGFTRASFGVQEFDADVQAAINRIQPADMVEEAGERLRAAGVGAINFDLIYGLPYQTVDRLSATVRRAAGMAPDRIALFGYAHVPWMAKNQRMIREAALPGPDARAAQAVEAARQLQAAGYEAVGIDHFARAADPLAVASRAGTLRRNFQGYTTDAAETLLGLGVTAISRTPFGYAQAIGDVRGFARALDEGRLPVARGHGFTGEDRIRAEAIEALMCHRPVDLDDLADRFGAPRDWARDCLPELDALAANGLVVRDGSRLALTPVGRPLARVVASAFDAYLGRAPARHSVAV
jgi:oxygen-independent coproporphyrinogen-3 oxidase